MDKGEHELMSHRENHDNHRKREPRGRECPLLLSREEIVQHHFAPLVRARAHEVDTFQQFFVLRDVLFLGVHRLHGEAAHDAAFVGDGDSGAGGVEEDQVEAVTVDDEMRC